MLSDEIAELEVRAKAAPEDFGGPDERTWSYIEYLSPARILRLVAHIREQAQIIAKLHALVKGAMVRDLTADNQIDALRSEVESLKAAREKLDVLSDYVLQDWKHSWAEVTLRRLAMEAQAWVKEHS